MTIDTDCSASIAGKNRISDDLVVFYQISLTSQYRPIFLSGIVMDSKGTVVTSKTATTFCVLLVSVGKCEAGSRVK